jgi:pimeloyl-ACP methyl ester carboxylesterase
VGNIARKDESYEHAVASADGTRISYISMGSGPSVIVIPGVLSMAADYAAFGRALAEHFTVHIMERRGRGESGPQGIDYAIEKECDDVRALRVETGAAFLVGHSYGGLIALEVARNDSAVSKVAVYEPGVSIDGSMPVDWMPGYERKLASNKRLDALVEFTLADAPRRIRRTPAWLMKLFLLLLTTGSKQFRQMLNLLQENLLEWKEIARLDSTYESYRDIFGDVLLMYGGKSDSAAVDLVVTRLPQVVPHIEINEFAGLDHFGIERTAPAVVARVVTDFLLQDAQSMPPTKAV